MLTARRRLVAFLAVVVVLAATSAVGTPVSAQAAPEVWATGQGDTITIGTDGSVRRSPSITRRAPGSVRQVWELLGITALPPGQSLGNMLVCARPRWVRVPPEPIYRVLPTQMYELDGMTYELIRVQTIEYPTFAFLPAQPCPPNLPLPAPRPPVVDAMSNWLAQRFLPPVPATMPPGFALVGLPATLTVGTLAAGSLYAWNEVVATPFGDVVVELTAVLHVQWGDGSSTVHEQLLGAGTGAGADAAVVAVEHTYINAGSVVVVVNRRWSGAWSMVDGSVQGVFTDELVTVTELPIEVRSLEARRTE